MFFQKNMELQEEFDWNLCNICQEMKKECLQCPVNASETHSHKEIGSGHITTTENLKAFSKLGAATSITKYFNNKEITSSILEENNGEWHKSCQLHFNSTKLNRLRKPSLEINDDNDETLRRKSLRTINIFFHSFPQLWFSNFLQVCHLHIILIKIKYMLVYLEPHLQRDRL